HRDLRALLVRPTKRRIAPLLCASTHGAAFPCLSIDGTLSSAARLVGLCSGRFVANRSPDWPTSFIWTRFHKVAATSTSCPPPDTSTASHQEQAWTDAALWPAPYGPCLC